MRADKEYAMKYLKQVSIAVAILLVLYGIAQLLNFLFDLANFPGAYYLLALFQIIAAVLFIFIGFRVYSVAKTIKSANLANLWEMGRNQIHALLLGSLALLPLMLYPLLSSGPPFYQAFPSTISELSSNPMFWLGKRVRVRGLLIGPLVYIPEAVPPYNFALYDPESKESFGILWKDHDYSLSNKNVWVIGIVKRERAPGVFGIEAYFIEAEVIVPKPMEPL